MDFAPLIEQDLRAFLNDVFRRVREWLDPFETALDAFVAELFSARLPANWRERWRHFVAQQAAAGFVIQPETPSSLRSGSQPGRSFAGCCRWPSLKLRMRLAVSSPKKRCSHDGRVAARATRGEKQSTIHAVQSSQWARRSKCVLERG